MVSRSRLLAIAAIAACAGCNGGRHSQSAFRLPPDADAERGKQAFVALGCHTCHEVAVADLPKPTVQPPVPVVLGGAIDVRLSDAYLVTSIIYPNFDLAPYPRGQITSNGESRMPHHFDQMTVRQLTDVVAFLQASYFVQKTPDYYH